MTPKTKKTIYIIIFFYISKEYILHPYVERVDWYQN